MATTWLPLLSPGVEDVLSGITTDLERASLTSDEGLISDEVMKYFYTINLSIICSLFSIFGIFTNTINIVVFVRQGFKETTNISLTALAISDICSLIALLWVGICFMPFFRYSVDPIMTEEIQHYTGGWTHVIFTRVTVFITAYVTLERCLCVVFPLKVKSMLSPRRTLIIVVSIYVLLIGTSLQNYFTFRLGWKHDPATNRSVFGNVYNNNKETTGKISYYLQIIYPLVAFSIVVVCTTILISKFNQRIKWRKSTTSGSNTSSADIRDRQVVKMVLYVAIVFIISFTPSLILFLNMIIIPGMEVGQKNGNMLVLCYSFSFISDAINSSVNIFVYYSNSSKYREQFQSLFCKQKKSVVYVT